MATRSELLLRNHRRALDVLHHQIVGSDVVQLADMGMIQRGPRHAPRVRIVRRTLRSILDGDDTLMIQCVLDTPAWVDRLMEEDRRGSLTAALGLRQSVWAVPLGHEHSPGDREDRSRWTMTLYFALHEC